MYIGTIAACVKKCQFRVRDRETWHKDYAEHYVLNHISYVKCNRCDEVLLLEDEKAHHANS